MEQPTSSPQGQLIYLSRNSKLARLFQETTARTSVATPAPPADIEMAPELPQARARASANACPKLQAVGNPTIELSRPLAAALMREQSGMRCRARGVLLDNEYVRDICAAGAHQHCPFLKG
jgi:hypothetical protein